jgi:hypothetical protein
MKLFKKAQSLLIIAGAWLLATAAIAEDQLFVQPGLDARINAGERMDLVVQFDMPDLSAAHDMEWIERGRWVHEQLRAAVERQQGRVRALLKRDGIAFESLNLGNLMIVESAGSRAFNHLLASTAVRGIYEYPEFTIIPPRETKGGQLPGVQGGGTPVTNLEQIFATDAWAAFGVEGDGITIGLNDSSPRHTHELMVDSYRGNLGDGSFDHNYAWFDPTDGVPAPVADFHGTLVLSIMVGDDGSSRTGVAPGAEWMACRGCQGTGCGGVIQCLDWFVAPTDVDGNNPDPDLRPMVVNNSWGSCETSYDDFYEPIWDSMYAAGVIPYISNGNASNCGYSSPPGLNTVGNPARGGRVMGIGSTTITGTLGEYAPHSNWGPTDDLNPGLAGGSFDDFGYPDLKPNVSAPGQNVPGAGSGSDTATTTSTGTSFASPHVTGAAAMVMSAAPCLIGDHVRINSILMDTATPVPYDGGPDDADVEPGVNHPNYATGWGEINVLAAANAASALCGPQGILNGVVTDSSSSNPIDGASVVVVNDDPPPDSWFTATDDTGAYELSVGAGTRDVEYSAFGYFPATETDVMIAEDGTMTLDVALDPAPMVNVTGIVSDGSTGWPLHARIDIDGYPDSPIYTDPADGRYSVMLPEGSTFDFTVTVLSGGYLDFVRDEVFQDRFEQAAATREVTLEGTPRGEARIEDFPMYADPLACSAPGYSDISPVAYLEDFEGSDGGFSVDVVSGDNAWEHGAPVTWPESCADGSGCWGTNLDGEYPNGADTTVTSPVIDLSGETAPLTLTWQQANHLETAIFDPGTVEISIAGGPWEVLWQSPEATVQVDWRELSADISNAAGETIQLRWTLDTDGSVTYNGLYFDQIVVRGAPNCISRPGELVSGRVDDANTSDPLLGAQISAGVGVPATSDSSEDPALGEGAYLLFVPEGTQTVTAELGEYQPGEVTDDFVDGNARRVDFALNAGRLSAAPEAMSNTLDFGDTDDQFLVLLNDGTAPVDVDLEVVRRIGSDFEGEFPPAGWLVENLGGDCVWATNEDVGRENFAGGEGRSAAADSDACGSGTTMDTALVSPEFVPGPGTSVDFVLSYRHLGSSRFDIDVSTNGGADWTTIQTYDADESAEGPGTPVSLPLADYAGENTQVRFRYVAPGFDWWAQVDQLEIDAPVDWLSITPSTGTFGIETLPIEVTYDAGAPSITGPGVYRANILVANDTPYGALDVPVTLAVGPGDAFGGISGTVQSAGYCGSDPFDAAGALIEVAGDSGTVYTTTADENGFYEIFVPIGESPVDVTAIAPNHFDGTERGVALVAGSTLPIDFTLDLDEPCIDVDPTEFSASLTAGDGDTQSLSLGNTLGAGDLEWSLATAQPETVGRNDGAAPASSGGSSVNAAVDLLTVSGGEIPRVSAVPAGTFDCDGAPGLVIHDDGSLENGYSGNPAAASEVTVVEAFPVDSPANLGTVCVALLSQGPTTRDFELVVFDDDGPGGTPGTELAAVASTATGLPDGIPDPIVWYTVDLGPENVAVEAGNVFIGTRWAPSDPNVFLGADEDGPGGSGLAFFRTDDNAWDQLGIDPIFPNYSALAVRPQIADPFGCSSPGDVSWLSFSADSGTVAAGDSAAIDVVIDSSGLLPGQYEATICVTSNDPVNPLIPVPVSLEVGAAAGTGILQGTMESLGYCSENPAPAAGASIEVVGQIDTYNLVADANGQYSIALDMAESPVTVNASAPDHQAQSLVDIDLIEQDVVDGSMDLVLIAPCASASTDRLEVEMALDSSMVVEMDLVNSGAADYTYSVETEEAIVPSGHVDPMARAIDGQAPRAPARMILGGEELFSYSFDDGDIPPDGWEHVITNPNYTWQTADFNPNSPPFNAEVLYNEDLVPQDEWLITPPIEVSSGVVSMWSLGSLFWCREDNDNCELNVWIIPGELGDGDEILLGRVNEDWTGTFVWSQSTFDLTPHLTGAPVRIGFQYVGNDGAQIGLDTISVAGEATPAACTDPQGTPWIMAEPTSGTVEAEGSQTLSVTFDSTGLPEGEFAANLCVSTSDAGNELIVIPAWMRVVEDGVFAD